jgi:TolA-binding protein
MISFTTEPRTKKRGIFNLFRGKASSEHDAKVKDRKTGNKPSLFRRTQSEIQVSEESHATIVRPHSASAETIAWPPALSEKTRLKRSDSKRQTKKCYLDLKNMRKSFETFKKQTEDTQHEDRKGVKDVKDRTEQMEKRIRLLTETLEKLQSDQQTQAKQLLVQARNEESDAYKVPIGKRKSLSKAHTMSPVGN